MLIKDILTLEKFPKEPKNGSYYVAACHDGAFHADDVFAAALLKLGFGEDNIIFIRTRSQEAFESADILFDVGRLYDGIRYFDHHQEASNLYEGKAKHSALTLLAKAMIKDQAILNEFNKKVGFPIAARDNGYDLSNIFKEFYSSPGSWIKYFNRTWREQAEFPDLNDRFAWFDAAVQVAKLILERIFICIIDELAVATEVRKQADQAIHFGQILLLDKYLPYQYTIVKEYPNIKFAIFKDTNNDNYMLCAIPLHLGDKFGERVYLPKAWRNYKEGEAWNGMLDVALDDAVYVHSGGFIGAWKTQESAIEAAKRAIKFNETD